MATPAPLSYALTGKQRIQWGIAYQSRTRPLRIAAGFVFIASSVVSAFISVRHPHDTLVRVNALLSVAVVVAAIVRMAYELRRTESRSLRFESKGMGLTRNAHRDFVSWYGVKAALAFKDFYAIERRDTSSPVLIPKATLFNHSAFWAFLEKRLEGDNVQSQTLGSPIATTRLANRLDQFLVDHATA